MTRLSFLLTFLIVLGWALPGAVRADDAAIRASAAKLLSADPATVEVRPAAGLGVEVLVDGKLAAFAGSTWDISHTAGYSGRPIDVLVAIDTNAVILGTELLQQEEPVLTLGIAPQQIAGYVGGFAGYDLKQALEPGKPRQGLPDAIAGATISSGVIRSGIIRTARSLAAQNGLLGGGGKRIDMASSGMLAWPELVSTGAIALKTISNAQADAAFATAGNADPAGSFIDLYAAAADPPSIGASLLGEGEYAALLSSMGPQDHLLFVAANGLYSFKGTAWRKSGIFERIEITQGSKTIALTRDQHHGIEKIAAEAAPELREKAVFVIPAASGFDPVSPFSLDLLASRADAAGQPKLARFALDYTLSQRFLLAAPSTPAQVEMPLWEQNWRSRLPAIAVVVAMLLALYVILILQNQIAARPPLYRKIRIAYLVATLVVMGGILGAQLSVVHVLTFLQALRTQFTWETFLLDPVIFIIWGWVAVALLFWGRVYCGWLCPFGALQELLNKLAQRLGVKQFAVPFMLHERLWPIKYILFLGLFAVSLASMTMAFKAAEVEPFKTAMTFRFMREWPFVLYAVALLAAGLFIERFYCRYLCPLGAALAIPARLRMFEWLKRRPQCGRECRICSTKCPVQAIHPEGHINPNECVYCLNCQTLYHDEHICPPLKARAARRASFTASGTPIP